MEIPMTKTKVFALATFLMASTSTVAISQTTPPEAPTGGAATTAPTTGAGSDTSTGTGTTGTTTGTGTATGSATGTAGMADDADHMQLITNLSMISSRDMDWAAEFETMSDDSDIKIVKLSELKASDDSSSPLLDQAISDLEESKADLQSAIEAEDKLTSALEAEDYAADDVVAAYVQPGTGDEVTLVVDDEGSSTN
jgi:hypothetical protein